MGTFDEDRYYESLWDAKYGEQKVSEEVYDDMKKELNDKIEKLDNELEDYKWYVKQLTQLIVENDHEKAVEFLKKWELI